MPMQPILRSTRAALSLGFLVLSLGCGGEPPPPAIEEPPPVDPRYASADAIVSHFNELTTHEPVQIRTFLDLIYIENDTQRQCKNLLESMFSLTELDQAFYERFGKHLNPDSDDESTIEPNEPASIVFREPQRARAEYKDFDGSTETLHVVQVGDRWWISGYTLEYDKDLEKMMKDLEEPQKFIDAMNSFAPEMIRRVRGGEFKDEEKARLAIGLKMIEVLALSGDGDEG